jgi:hypothetical protein
MHTQYGLGKPRLSPWPRMLAVTSGAMMQARGVISKADEGSLVDEVMRPDLPEVSFDWDPERWGEAARRAVELVVDVSTGWERRRPGPAASPD